MMQLDLNVKIIVIVLSVAILAIAGIAFLSSDRANELLQDRIERQLISEASTRGQSIESLIELHIQQVKIFASDEDIQYIAKKLLEENTATAPANNTAFSRYHSNFKDEIARFQSVLGNTSNIKAAHILNPNGTIGMSLDSHDLGKRISDFYYPVLNSSIDSDVSFNFAINKIDNRTRVAIISVPIIFNLDNSTSTPATRANSVAANAAPTTAPTTAPSPAPASSYPFLSIVTDVSDFDNVLLNRKGLGETGEVYLVNNNKLLISESRFISDAEFDQIVDTMPVRECFDNEGAKSVHGVYEDYRGVSIVGFSHCIPEKGIVLLAEIDVAEVSKPILDLRDAMVETSISIGVIVASITLIALIVILSWNKSLKKAVDSKTKELRLTMGELEQANEQLKLHDKMQQEFINIAAHELRTPVQAIGGFSEMLQYGEYRDETKKKKAIYTIYKNARRLQRLTNDILDITRIESGTLKLKKIKLNLYDLVSDAVAEVELLSRDSSSDEMEVTNKNIKFHFEQNNHNNDTDASGNRNIDKNAFYVEADKGRIYQVLFNILNNAIKFTDNGNIEVNISIGKVKLSETSTGEQVIVSIKDTGKGIDANIMPKLFNKFVTKYESGGTGLGLYISKSIIEAHGGRIWAENNANGKGANFYFSLPLLKK